MFFRKSDTHAVVDSVVRVKVFTQTHRQESAVVTIMKGNVTTAGLWKRNTASLQEIFILRYQQPVQINTYKVMDHFVQLPSFLEASNTIKPI
jgi:hypothetical protein